jgi:hypothetical protein
MVQRAGLWRDAGEDVAHRTVRPIPTLAPDLAIWEAELSGLSPTLVNGLYAGTMPKERRFWGPRRTGHLRTAGRGPTARPGVIRVRRVVNWVNLSTPLGLLVAALGGARLRPGPHGLLIATGYRYRVPPVTGRAITIGDVVLLGLDQSALDRRPDLFAHEARHAAQCARWMGPVGFLPAYAVASLWSWWFTGNAALRNHFEGHAGLVDGGYCDR